MTTTRGWLSALSAAATLLSLLPLACEGGNIDAGRGLPVDQRNPVIVANDSPTDNWTGEYAMLLGQLGRTAAGRDHREPHTTGRT